MTVGKRKQVDFTRWRSVCSVPPRFSVLLCVLPLLLLSRSVVAQQSISISLGSATKIESTGNVVLNSALGYAHPRLQTDDWDSDLTGPLQSLVFSIGDGRHGSFNRATYLNFDDGTYAGDQVVHINTDAYPDLQFTDFTLESGWTIRPSGSQPLVIRSLSGMSIEGLIDCSGEVGGGLTTDKAVSPAGGVGRCGGGDGGRGGSTSNPASNGAANSGNAASGGSAGSADGGGGGGGGSMAQAGSGADTGATFGGGAGGAAGTQLQDDAFTLVSGGGGGGGGALYDNPGDVANQSSGGGGGGGGGSISLYAKGEIRVSASGSVRAEGGRGGGPLGTGKGGAGGGGGGGSILMFTAGDIISDGTISAARGGAGLSNGGVGGQGGYGRTWVIDADGVAGGSVPEDPISILPFYGLVNYEQARYIIVSEQLDLQNSAPVLVSAVADTTVSGASSATLEMAAADAPFAAADATWVNVADSAGLSQVSGKRYVRLRLTLDNQSETSPAVARSIVLTYRLGEQTKFDFTTSCALTRESGSGRIGGLGHQLGSVLLLLAPLAYLLYLRRRALFTIPVSE